MLFYMISLSNKHTATDSSEQRRENNRTPGI